LGAGAQRTRSRERTVSRPPATTDAVQGGDSQRNTVLNAIRFNLVLPAAKMGFGPFSFDPIEQAIGAPVAEILASLMTGPLNQRPSRAGPAMDVYPLAIPDGEGLTFPLGPWGELGFRNEEGLLVLTAPMPTEGWIQRKLSDSLVRGPEQLLSRDGSSRVSRFWLELHSGMNVVLPLGVVGEIRIESI
jgi:hypothetical protein